MIDVAVVESLISDACEVVDGFLRGRYTLPLDTVPTLVKKYSIELVRHALYARRPENADIPETVRRLYNDAMAALAHIRNGKLHLGVEATGVDQPEAGVFRVRSKKKTFSDDVLDMY